MKKYNLALLPQTKSRDVIQLAQHFSEFAHQYILGEHSLPHVTLYHFYYDENEINHLIQQAQSVWQESPIYLTFKTFSYLTLYKDVYWVSLIPDHLKKLHAMHAIIADLIHQPIKENFDPHMTLFNCENNAKDQDIKNHCHIYKTISDDFKLALGYCDEVGQFTEIIHQF